MVFLSLDVASAPPPQCTHVSQEATARYGVQAVKSDDPLLPALFVPPVVPVPAQMEEQLRAFRATARYG